MSIKPQVSSHMRTNLSDRDLVVAFKGGDARAYAAIYREYRPVAESICQRILGNADDAQEAAQEAFVKAYRALDRFRPGAPFRPWLLQIVANEGRNRRRSAGRQERLALRAAEDRPSGDAAPSPEAAVLEHEERRALLDAVNAMREDDRLIISYRYFMDLSEKETADALGIPKGTVKSRLSRALARLRDQLGAGSLGALRG